MSSTNPFPAEASAILRFVRSEPSGGFRARLIVLAALGAVALVSGVTHAVCRHLIAVRHRGGHGKGLFWLVRLVKRKSGSFIVLNPILLKEVCCIIMASMTAVIVGVSWSGFFSNGSIETVYSVTEFVYWPISFILGWSTTIANLQTFLILREDQGSHSRVEALSAKVANALFVGWLVIGTALTTAMSAYHIHQHIRIDGLWQEVYEFAVLAGERWQPNNETLTNLDLASLGFFRARFTSAFHAQLSAAGKAWGVYIIMHVFIILVTVSTYPLVQSLKAQIQSSLSELKQQASYVAEQSNEPADSSSPDEFYLHMSKVPSLSQVKAMAERQSMSLEAAKRLRTMSRIANDLQIQLIGFSVIGTMLLAGCIFAAVVYPRLDEYSWAAREVVLYWPAWASMAPGALSFVAVAANSIYELRTQSLTAQGGSGTTSSGEKRLSAMDGRKLSVAPSARRDSGVEVIVECVTREDKDEESEDRKGHDV